MFNTDLFVRQCQTLRGAYEEWKLWYMRMPEDNNPWFSKQEWEKRLVYFTLPMALNYQRNSYALRESVLNTYYDEQTHDVFDIKNSAEMDEEDLRQKLLKHKIALQPNKHLHTWRSISKTIFLNRWTMTSFFENMDYDFLPMQKTIQKDYKTWFPYLSGPKIFHYWSFIIQEYGTIWLKNAEWIDIAPDTHITKCSVKLGIITQHEADSMPKEQISQRRRETLQGTGIDPIDMHSPLRFRSKNNFQFEL